MRERVKRWWFAVLAHSVDAAVRAQGLASTRDSIARIVPDLSDQYTHTAVEDTYYTTKVRGQHAFEVALAGEALKDIEAPTIVDIGDSSGTHLRYITQLSATPDNVRTLSVNLDPAAVERIRSKGLDAECMRAEDLAAAGIDADVFLVFETLEHLSDPVTFLHSLATGTHAKRLVVTVPYVRDSRVGLDHIRRGRTDFVTAEDAHVFELDPDDWKLLALHSGWRAVKERIYLQYPRFGLLRVTAPWWRRRDFEGFYGIILERDDTWSSRYADWREP